MYNFFIELFFSPITTGFFLIDLLNNLIYVYVSDLNTTVYFQIITMKRRVNSWLPLCNLSDFLLKAAEAVFTAEFFHEIAYKIPLGLE